MSPYTKTQSSSDIRKNESLNNNTSEPTELEFVGYSVSVSSQSQPETLYVPNIFLFYAMFDWMKKKIER